MYSSFDSSKIQCTHTDPLFNNLKLFKLDEIIELETIQFNHRVTHKKSPSPILKLLDIPIVEQNNNRRVTRNLNMPTIKNHSSNNSFLGKGIRIWQNSSVEIRYCKTISSLQSSYLDHKLNN